MTIASLPSSPKHLNNWQNLLKNITPELSKVSLGTNFVQPLLKELGFDTINFVEKDYSFTGLYRDRNISVRSDYACWQSGQSLDKATAPILLVETQSVKENNIDLACETLHQNMQVAEAKFGIATDGLEIQLWQRHGKYCVPRTPKQQINIINIQEIVDRIKSNLQKPRRALTAMFWSPKGGVGKTTITGNIGAALSKQSNLKVLLISFDTQGDLNSMFGIPTIAKYQPRLGLHSAIYLGQEDNINIHQLITKHKIEINISQGVFAQKKAFYLDIIPADRSLNDLEVNSASDNLSLEKFLAKDCYDRYDYILIDAPTTWQGMTKIAALATDIIIPIIDNANFGVDAIERMQNNYLTAKQFDKNSLSETPPKTIGYIINSRCQIKSSLESSIEKIQTRLVELNLLRDRWILPHYAEIERSHENNEPVVYSHPNSEAAKKFAAIASDIFL